MADSSGRIKHPWGISTPYSPRGTRDGYPARLLPCVIPLREWPLACKPGLFTDLTWIIWARWISSSGGPNSPRTPLFP